MLSWLRRPHLDRWKQLPESDLERLRRIRMEYFPRSDEPRFFRIWCEVARIIGVKETDLDVHASIAGVCPPVLGGLMDSDAMDELCWFAVRETKGRRLRHDVGDLRTVREYVAFLVEHSEPGSEKT